MKINILGSTYEIIFTENPTPYMEENGFGGLADYDKQEITIVTKFYGNNIEKYEDEVDKSQQFIEDTLTHELAHAFLNESGQEDINNERTVEVMSKFVKFIKKEVFKKVGD